MFPSVPGIRIVRRLGGGGMGTVYLAVDATNRALALKFIAESDTDPHARERFEREIAAVSSIRHANVMRFVRAGEADGRPYALFERVRGRSMARIGPQPWTVVVALGRQLAHAIAAVHAAGWMHRDIKRSNVMVGDHGLVTLIDFGLAKRWSDRDARRRPVRPTHPALTVTGMVVGTPRYLAPETRRGAAATPATDVYSLGLVLHELLGGTVDAEGRMGSMRTGVPLALATLVTGALDADPQRRPPATSIAAILDILPSMPARFTSRLRDDVPTWPLDADGRLTCGDGVSIRKAG